MEDQTMKTHYTEADLLETYYTQPGESMPVMMHLASCSECAARYERLDRKMREAAACHTERTESDWATQRAAIMNRIRAPRRSVSRFAAAAALVLTIGGTIAYQVVRNEAPASPPAQTLEEAVSSDPWQSDELQEFGAVVEWETWIEEKS